MAQPGTTYTPTATAKQWISHSANSFPFFKEKNMELLLLVWMKPPSKEATI